MYLRQAKPAGCSRWKPPAVMRDLHSLKLTEHQKNGGWETILSFWETPFSGTFVVSFRESTFFGCQRSLCLRGISGFGQFGGFLKWLQVGGLCQERLFFYGQNLSPLPQNQILVWRCKRILNIFHARWFNQSDLFGEWWISVTLLGMVENVTSNEKGDEVWSHPLTWWLLLFESSWSCNLHHPKQG